MAGVNNAEHRVVTTLTTQNRGILLFDATAVSAGTIVDNTLKYLRFTNLDSSNNIRISEGSGTNQQQYAVVVKPGELYPWE